ncbi:DTW domain-containing protein [Pelagicoccus albus]|uniref:tRNA-uridine aminocarboxypropyltransferase n=1 Tax=Pelagicoccus albus TaxID=415222 RepID=A0A7X1B3Y3_9BACT|nr:DTW domain-containing protein [Pelagicoccus albus]
MCWCGQIKPMPSRTKFVILMHPYEHRRVKLNTGRLTHFCLADSELIVGDRFDNHDRVQSLIHDPANFPVLLYPGSDARDLSKGELAEDDFVGRRLVVFLLDGTWRKVRPMLRESLSLQALPKIMFSEAAPSRYLFKKQPEPGCLSTLEAAHELLLVLDRYGLDDYSQPDQMLDLFMSMQVYQVNRERENRKTGSVPKKDRSGANTRFNPSKRRKVFTSQKRDQA